MKLFRYKKLSNHNVRCYVVLPFILFMLFGVIIGVILPFKLIGLILYCFGTIGLILASLILTKYDLEVFDEKLKNNLYV